MTSIVVMVHIIDSLIESMFVVGKAQLIPAEDSLAMNYSLTVWKSLDCVRYILLLEMLYSLLLLLLVVVGRYECRYCLFRNNNRSYYSKYNNQMLGAASVAGQL